MDEILKALKKIGLTANILLIVLIIWFGFGMYKNYLETRKLNLEIDDLLAKRKSDNNNQQSIT